MHVKYIFFIGFLAFLHSFFYGVYSIGATAASDELSLPDVDMEIGGLMSRMSLSQKVGQLFLIGFQGTEISEGLAQAIREVKPGGLIFFGRNIQTARQTSRLIHQAQVTSIENNAVPLLMTVDQEGGMVSRIKLNPPFPSALAIGMAGSEEISERMGYYSGVLLKSLGFNMNLAPVVDMISDHAPTFIGNRAFAIDPNTATEYSTAFATGQQLAGIISTYKHFPGHGTSFTDSHITLPMRYETLEQIMNKDLLPYQNLGHNVLPDAVMVAHIAFPNIDPSRLPATFSKVFMQDILRKRLKFDGIAITDDIEMAGAKLNGSLGTRAVKSLVAGADMIMVAWNRVAQKSCVQAVLDAIREGTLTEARIDESLIRVLNTKRALGILRQVKPPNLRSYRSLILSQSISDLTGKILELSVAQSAENLPIRKGKYPPRVLGLVSSRKSFHQSFAREYSGRTAHYNLGQLKKGEFVNLLRKNPGTLGLVHVTSRQVARMLNIVPLSLRSRVIIINADSPGIIDCQSCYRYIFNLYTQDGRAGGYLGSTLREYFRPSQNQQIIPEARLPAGN